jgi:hypothetical protein
MSRRLLMISLILWGATNSGINGAYSMQFSKLEYLYSVMEQKPDILTIDNSGHARYESYSNVETPYHPEIGAYEKDLSRNEMELLQRMLDNPPLENTPDHWGRVRPSDHYKRIRVRFGAKTLEKLVGTREPVEPSLRALIDHLDRTVAQVRTQPQLTLRSTLSEMRASPAGVVMAKLSLFNSGTQPVLCRNPAKLLAAPDGKLAIELWPDKPPGVLQAEDSISADVGEVVTVRLPVNVPIEHEIVQIPPKESASFRIRANVQLKKVGVYMARLLYMTTAEEINGRIPLVGELYSAPMQVTVHEK